MNWSDALRTTLLDFVDKPFEWGVVDCCQLARRYYRRLTGEDLGESLDYDSRVGAYRLMSRYGTLSDMLRWLLGERTPMVVAGDIVIIEMEEALCVGIYNGSNVWTITEAQGLVRVDARYIKEGWRCPLA